MEPFPDVTNKTIFPALESHTMELKLGVSPVIKNKCIPTICAFLNAKGGYIVFGVEDKERRIVGVQASGHELNNELLWFDNFYHVRRITDSNGDYLEPGTLEARIIEVRTEIRIIVLTIRPTPGKTYKCQDGSVWYRLSASIFRIKEHSQEKESDRFINEKKKRELSKELYNLKEDFKNLLGAAKNIDKQLDMLSDAVNTDILHRKEMVEKDMEEQKYNLIHPLQYVICGMSICVLTTKIANLFI